MFKAILLSNLCSLLLLQANETENLICAKDIFTEQEATLPSGIEDDTSKKKRNKSSQSVPKPSADENATTPSLLSPQADKEIFQDE